MRIVAGKYRGRTLRGPHGLDLRPTSDRLRETLFDILGASVHDAVFVDAFAGTGAIGLEALSRGAREVVFIESSSEGVRLIRENIKLCKIPDGYSIMQQEAFFALRHLARRQFRCSIMFLDPPYRWNEYGALIEIIFRLELVQPGAVVIVEHHRKAALTDTGDDFRRARVVRQGDHCLSFYVPNSNDSEP